MGLNCAVSWPQCISLGTSEISMVGIGVVEAREGVAGGVFALLFSILDEILDVGVWEKS